MNQPTREEFEEFKQEIRQEIRQEVRQLREQRTEEIKVTRIEVASEDVLKRLDKLEQGEEAHFDAMVKTVEDSTKELKDTLASKEDIAEARADILKIRESQADFRDAMATKDDIAALKTTQDEQHAMLRQILQILGQKPK